MLLMPSAAIFGLRLCRGLKLQGKAAHSLLWALLLVILAGSGFPARAATYTDRGCLQDSAVEPCIRSIEDAVSPRLPRVTAPGSLLLPDARGPAVGPLIRGLPSSPRWQEWRASYAPALRQAPEAVLSKALSGLVWRAKGSRSWVKALPIELRQGRSTGLPPVELVMPTLMIQNLVVETLGGKTVELRMRMLRVTVAVPVARPVVVPPGLGRSSRSPGLQPFPARPAILETPAPAPIPLAPAAAGLIGALGLLLVLKGFGKGRR